MVMGVMILILVPTVMTDDHDNCVEKSNLREELLYSLRNALKRLPVTSQDYSEPERWTAADVGGSEGDFGVLGPSDFGDGDRLMPLIRCINNNNKCAEDDVPTSGQLRAIFSAERAAPPISFLRARLLRSWSSSFSYDIIITITIITTRPKPAYGRQGLAGSWGQDTDEVSTFLMFLTSHFAPVALSSDLKIL